MKTIVLDTNTILSAPTVLAQKSEGISLIIPHYVLTELAFYSFTRDDAERINNLVHFAIHEGYASVHKLRNPSDMNAQTYISGTDFDILATAQELVAEGKDVSLATEEIELVKAANLLTIPSIGIDELRKLVAHPKEINHEWIKLAKAILAGQTKKLVFGILVGILINIVANILWPYANIILDKLSVWGTILLILFIGVALYAVRGRYRLIYGVLEFSFGFTFSLRIFWPQFDYSTLSLSDYIPIIAGFYVMVRGLDNIGKAISKTRFSNTWKRLFADQ